MSDTTVTVVSSTASTNVDPSPELVRKTAEFFYVSPPAVGAPTSGSSGPGYTAEQARALRSIIGVLNE